MQLDTSITVPLARSRQTATDITPRESGGSADVHSITADGVLALSNRSRVQLVGDAELAPALLLPSHLCSPSLPSPWQEGYEVEADIMFTARWPPSATMPRPWRRQTSHGQEQFA